MEYNIELTLSIAAREGMQSIQMTKWLEYEFYLCDNKKGNNVIQLHPIQYLAYEMFT